MRKIKRKDNFVSNIIPINLFLFDTKIVGIVIFYLMEREMTIWENELFNPLRYIRFYRNEIEKLKYLPIIF